MVENAIRRILAGDLNPDSSGIWLFISLMVVMVIGTAVTGRKGRKK